METAIQKRLFTVHDYHRMVEAGILSEDDRVELIRGEVFAMSPIGPRHNAAVLRANQSLVRLVGDRAIFGIQGSIRMDEYDDPTRCLPAPAYGRLLCVWPIRLGAHIAA